MELREEILVYARKIAAMEYPADLLAANNGLQPLEDWILNGVVQPGLLNKYKHELIEEFREANIDWMVTQNKEKLAAKHSEAADCVYYAIQIDEQKGTLDTLEDTLINLAGPTSQIDPDHAKIAARTKYEMRAEKPNNKDPARENIAIERAINRYDRLKAREMRQGPGVLSARRIPSRVIAAYSRKAEEKGETLENFVRMVLINYIIGDLQNEDNKDLLKELLKEAVEQMKL